MDLSPEQSTLFEDPLCSSDTEQKPNGEIESVQSSWRSPLFEDLAHQLDQSYIQMKAEGDKKHNQNKHGYSFWGLRKPGKKQESSSNVPVSLPRNCYHPKMLSSADPTTIQALDLQEEVDISSILNKLVLQ